MGEVLKKFGRYFLLDHIAQGGMAEIYRARLASTDGAGRLIVIKRVQAGFGGNSEFLQMFKSEIKVTMGFNHPNIVQLYDFGEENNQPYIAMEFVDGRNVRQFSTRFSEMKQTFPVDLAAYVVEQAAAGLHYAHTFKDKITGEPLNLVHRDISPQNIMISYEGNVKVIDFGIAKAATNSEATRAGVIKGKPSYLSPEQISGEVLDGRSDVFALGIVLWELLVGRKLFQGDNDLAVLKQIEACQTHVKAPSTLNPNVPKEFDYIVLKALAKQREKRFQSAEEFQRALHKFLYTFNPDFNPSDVSYYAKDLFKNEIVEDRKRIQKLNDKVEQLLQIVNDAPAVEMDHQSPEKPKREDSTTHLEANGRRAGSAREAFDSSALKGQQKIEVEITPHAARAGVARRSEPTGSTRNPAARESGTVSGILRPTPSQLQQRPAAAATPAASKGGFGKGLVAAAAAIVGIAILGPQFGVNLPFLGEGSKPAADRTPSSTGSASSVQQSGAVKQPPAQVARPSGGVIDLSNGAPIAKTVLLRLNVVPGGRAQVVLNGKSVDPSVPIRVPLDAPLELTAQQPGYKAFEREFVLQSSQVNGLKEWMMDVPLEPVRYGTLTIHSTPSADAMIMLDGKPWVKKTPFENEKLPIGTYNVRLVNEVLGMEKTVTISIQDGKAVSLDESLDVKGPSRGTASGQ